MNHINELLSNMIVHDTFIQKVDGKKNLLIKFSSPRSFTTHKETITIHEPNLQKGWTIVDYRYPFKNDVIFDGKNDIIKIYSNEDASRYSHCLIVEEGEQNKNLILEVDIPDGYNCIGWKKLVRGDIYFKSLNYNDVDVWTNSYESDWKCFVIVSKENPFSSYFKNYDKVEYVYKSFGQWNNGGKTFERTHYNPIISCKEVEFINDFPKDKLGVFVNPKYQEKIDLFDKLLNYLLKD